MMTVHKLLDSRHISISDFVTFYLEKQIVRIILMTIDTSVDASTWVSKLLLCYGYRGMYVCTVALCTSIIAHPKYRHFLVD